MGNASFSLSRGVFSSASSASGAFDRLLKLSGFLVGRVPGSTFPPGNNRFKKELKHEISHIRHVCHSALPCYRSTGSCSIDVESTGYSRRVHIRHFPQWLYSVNVWTAGASCSQWQIISPGAFTGGSFNGTVYVFNDVDNQMLSNAIAQSPYTRRPATRNSR